MRVTLNSKADKPVALISGSNWNLECWFLWREENRRTRRKTLGAGKRTNNKLNPHVAPGPGIEPGPQWWEASALTTAPSLAPPMHFSEKWRVAISKTESKQFHQQVSKGNSESILARDVQEKELIWSLSIEDYGSGLVIR